MDLVPNARGEEDETMLRLPTRDQVLTRLVFPVVPCLEDVSELKNVPFFGDDLRAARFGIRRLSETEMEGKKATMERMRARGGTWEGYVKETCTLNKCIVQSEVMLIFWNSMYAHLPWLMFDFLIAVCSCRSPDFN